MVPLIGSLSHPSDSPGISLLFTTIHFIPFFFDDIMI